MRLALALLACAIAASASGLDGRWTAEASVNNKNGQKVTAFTLDLKSQDGLITGSVSVMGTKKARPLAIQEGKISGNRLSFVTVQNGKKADVKFYWDGKLDGDQITGSRTRDGARRGQSFTAHREPAI
jgi:hypothetical protein